METFWGKFYWDSQEISILEDGDVNSIYLSNAELHWTTQSQLIHCEYKNNWLIFVWGYINRSNRDSNTQKIIDEIFESLRNGMSVIDIIHDYQGDFSLIIWDEIKCRLHIATDQFGITKTYYSTQGDGIFVTSHPRNLAKHGIDLKVSNNGLTMLFSLKGIIAPYSIYNDVYVLKPAELLELWEDGSLSKEYWNILDILNTPYEEDYETAQKDLIDILNRTIQKNLVNKEKNPVGIFLSSGLDSTFLLGLLKNNEIPSIAYTVGYNPSTTSDESYQAIRNAGNIGTPISAFHPTDVELYNLLENAVETMAEPCADATILPQLHLTKNAYPSSIFFDGTGADNIFGGLRRFRAEELVKQYQLIPPIIRKRLLLPLFQTLPSSRKSKFSNWMRKFQKFSYGAELPSELRSIYWLRFLPEDIVQSIIKPEFVSSNEFINEHFISLSNKASSLKNNYQKSTYITIKSTLPIYAMQKLRYIQMATGVKIFTPYISSELVPWAMRLPKRFIMNPWKNKIILRDSLNMLMPRHNSTFLKASFLPPMNRWINGVFKDEFVSLMNKQEFFQKDYVNLIINQQNDNYRDWQWELWLIFIFLKWWDTTNR